MAGKWVTLTLFMMKFLLRIYLFFRSTKVGGDQYGNQYFEAKRTDSFGRKKRFCLYSGRPEASKISPEWHLFMHYQVEAKDVKTNYKQHKWQKPFVPDITLTEVKYLPKNHPLFSSKNNLFHSSGAKNPFKIKIWKPSE